MNIYEESEKKLQKIKNKAIITNKIVITSTQENKKIRYLGFFPDKQIMDLMDLRKEIGL